MTGASPHIFIALTTSGGTAPAAPPKRRWRNFLLDTGFQLKLTAYIVGVTVVLSALLGVFLARGARALMRETEAAVEAPGCGRIGG